MIETYLTVRMDKPVNVASLVKRTGYTELEVETYLEMARFAQSPVMHLPIKRDLDFSKL
jgi:hypothetical protein